MSKAQRQTETDHTQARRASSPAPNTYGKLRAAVGKQNVSSLLHDTRWDQSLFSH